MISIKVPESLQEEHEEIFNELRRFAKMNGSTAKSIRALLIVLEPHFTKEDELAMPLLGVISDAAFGRRRGNFSDVTPLFEKFRKEYKNMLIEHQDIRARIADARVTAKEERRHSVLEVLDALEHHAKIEDEVLYPAALLTGAVIKAFQAGTQR